MSHLSRYVQMSTANPTGWRPWQSRLQGLNGGLGAYYIRNTFPLPTTSHGPWLMSPGCNYQPTVNGGMGDDTQILGVSVDPTLLIAGVGVLLLAVYLLGSGKPKRKARRLRKRISRSQQQLRDLAV